MVNTPWYSHVYHQDRQLLPISDNYYFPCVLLSFFLPKFGGGEGRTNNYPLTSTTESLFSYLLRVSSTTHDLKRTYATCTTQNHKKHFTLVSLGKPTDILFTAALNNAILSIKSAFPIFTSAPSNCELLISAGESD